MKTIKLPETYKYFPIFLSMRCNLDCSFCLNAFSNSFDRRGFEELEGEDWIRAINRIESRPGVPVTFSGGEPSLHKDFIYILNNIKPDLNIDILTNLWWNDKKIDNFISKVDPYRIRRDAPYPSIRVSYHPEQMRDANKLVTNVLRMKDAGFSIGIESVMYPSPEHLENLEQMAARCRNEGISFRPKSFTGVYEGIDDAGRGFAITHGNYSKYPDCAFQSSTKSCSCKTSELLVGSNGDVYKCHRDLFAGEFPIGNLLNPDFEIRDGFRECDKYGNCHPCDVKLKTNYKQEPGHTSVEIKQYL